MEHTAGEKGEAAKAEPVEIELYYWRCPRCGRVLVEVSYSRLKFAAENHCRKHGNVTFANPKVIRVALT